MSSNDAFEYHKQRLIPFVGARVVSVIVDSEDDPDVYCGFILQLSDGRRKQIVWYCDPEGNGPGHLDIMDAS